MKKIIIGLSLIVFTILLVSFTSLGTEIYSGGKQILDFANDINIDGDVTLTGNVVASGDLGAVNMILSGDSDVDNSIVAGYLKVSGRSLMNKGIDVASANDLTLGTDGNAFDITGTTTINRIASAGWEAGSLAVLKFDAALTVAANQSAGSGFYGLKLNGGVSYNAVFEDVLYLYFDGEWWWEVGRRSTVRPLTANLTADLTTSGDTVAGTVDSNTQGAGNCVYYAADGHYDDCDADAAASVEAFALVVGTGTGAKILLLKGFIRNDAWNFTTLGANLYVSPTDGLITDTAPSGSGQFIKRIGKVISSKIVYVDFTGTVIGIP